METKIKATEVDFENFITLFYSLLDHIKFNNIFIDKNFEQNFIEPIVLLERNLQDIDTTNDYDKELRAEIITELTYLDKVIKSALSEDFISKYFSYYILEALVRKFTKINILLNERGPSAHKLLNYKNGVQEDINPDFMNTLYSPDYAYYISIAFLIDFLPRYFLLVDTKVQSKFIQDLALLDKLLDDKTNISNDILNYANDLINNQEIRIIPEYLYIENSKVSNPENYYDIFNSFLRIFGFRKINDFKAKRGSWIKRKWNRLVNSDTGDAVVKRLEKVEHALELQQIEKVQSEINVNYADVLSKVYESFKDLPRFIHLVGSMLVVKYNSDNNEPIVISRILTTEELIYIGKNPFLLNQPQNILSELSKFNSIPKAIGGRIEGLLPPPIQ
jgi:hypothetical protein